MLMESMNAAPRPWTLLPPSGGVPAGGGAFDPASCGEGILGFFGSSGKRSSAMIYMAIIRAFWAHRSTASGAKKLDFSLFFGPFFRRQPLALSCNPIRCVYALTHPAES